MKIPSFLPLLAACAALVSLLTGCATTGVPLEPAGAPEQTRTSTADREPVHKKAVGPLQGKELDSWNISYQTCTALGTTCGSAWLVKEFVDGSIVTSIYTTETDGGTKFYPVITPHRHPELTRPTAGCEIRRVDIIGTGNFAIGARPTSVMIKIVHANGSVVTVVEKDGAFSDPSL